MNIIDVFLLLIIGVSIVFAIYRGFLASLLGAAACVAALFIALYAGPKLADALGQNQGVTDLLTTYTDAGSMIGDASLRTLSLPPVVQDMLRQNVQRAAFEKRGIYNIGQYLSATIVSVLLRAVCFLVCFFLGFLALHILINLVDHVFYFPVLRHMNGPAAALMGAIRGIVIVYVILIIIPLVRTAIPFDMIQQYIDGSRFFPILYSEKLLLRVIGG